VQVRDRAERAVRTLTEVDKWRKRTDNIEATFDSRDLPKVGLDCSSRFHVPVLTLAFTAALRQIAEELQQMRQSLSAMGQTEEFKARSHELTALQSRLEVCVALLGCA
jgi:hypothetical protein